VIVLPANTLDQPLRGFEPLRLLLAQMARDQKKDIIVGIKERNSSGVWQGARIFSADKFNKDTDYVKYRLLPIIEYTPLTFLNALLPNAVKQQLNGNDANLKAS